jgi:hypothetical protein
MKPPVQPARATAGRGLTSSITTFFPGRREGPSSGSMTSLPCQWRVPQRRRFRVVRVVGHTMPEPFRGLAGTIEHEGGS